MPESNTSNGPYASPNTENYLIIGQVEDIDNGTIKGWALDRRHPKTPLQLRVNIDEQLETVITCNIERPELSGFNLPSSTVGFCFRAPLHFHDGTLHRLTLATLDGATISLPNRENQLCGAFQFAIESCGIVDGMLEEVVGGCLRGWALLTDVATGRKTGRLRLLISLSGQPIAEITADELRMDVANTFKSDPFCGFTYPLSPEVLAKAFIKLEVHALPSRRPLRCSPKDFRPPSLTERSRIMALIAKTDELLKVAHAIRKELSAVLPVNQYSLTNYEAWALQNLSKIAGRAAARYGDIKGCPLVSILCPVFRPDLADFLENINSVRLQTYQNWEMIVVDDGNRESEVRHFIASMVAGEPRIRAVTQMKNTGISGATNQALAEARGEVVVLLDQDDLLDVNALEVMLRARSATGASLLYSDEDKIGQSGKYSDPNLKPDFNYRMLLDLNYIGHLMMLDTALLREIGGFDPAYDGAQDHDLLLRVTEHISPETIHHVPEILYHWRLSADSTSSDNGAKPKAAAAGRRAVLAHLGRRKVEAKVSFRESLTCYKVSFIDRSDPGVSILIPFRDHIEETRRCVDAIRASFVGLMYEIILLDNWSSCAAAAAFCATQAEFPNTRVIKIAEPFNYSRINNIGAAAAKFPFLLFLNNDVVVNGCDWLRILLSEALADKMAAAIGAKLLYPDGAIQHAGVVLGVNGVAEHAFRGLPMQTSGYIAHAIIAREVAAVTAACMLVRADAFKEVGGFDEEELAIVYNDVDLCIKFRSAGYRIIFTPDCIAEHHESLSRGNNFDEDKLPRFIRETQVMQERWGHLLSRDPFYNPHFSRDGGVYRDLRVLHQMGIVGDPKKPIGIPY